MNAWTERLDRKCHFESKSNSGKDRNKDNQIAFAMHDPKPGKARRQPILDGNCTVGSPVKWTVDELAGTGIVGSGMSDRRGGALPCRRFADATIIAPAVA